MRHALVLVCSLLLITAAYSQPGDSARSERAITGLERDIPPLMKVADIPGLSAALIYNGKIVWRHHFGVSNAETRTPVTDETIFEAASLSKVVTAYAALKLVDEGKLNLDTPLNKYLGNNYEVGNDPRIHQITARRVLSHSAGFPNWRPQGDSILPINFTPGEKFSYSGEGFVYLAKVIEHITHTNFEAYIKRTVFTPLGMKQSSFVWQDNYDQFAIYRHDWLGNKSFRFEGKGYNAAASLHTTARDYATFMIALINGTGLKKKTWQQMFAPQIQVDAQKNRDVAWGLGVGLETTQEGKVFWHWGDQGDSKCFMAANPARKTGIVYFTNSSNGLSILKEMLTDAIGGEHPAIAWLDYPRYNPAAKALVQDILNKGATVALKDYTVNRSQHPDQNIGEGSVNSIGYLLLRMKKVEEAIAVFTQNTVDFPQSGNVWDSLAEAYMINGNKELAIKYYEQAVQLDPGNSNAVEQIKKLRK